VSAIELIAARPFTVGFDLLFPPWLGFLVEFLVINDRKKVLIKLQSSCVHTLQATVNREHEECRGHNIDLTCLFDTC